MAEKDKLMEKLGSKDYVERQIGKYRPNIDFPQVYKVDIEDVSSVFPSSTSLKRIKAIDAHGNVVGDLLAQIYSPSRRTITLSQPNLVRGERLEYNAEHQKFWSENNEPFQIPTPQFYDHFKEGRRHVLVIQYWPGPSHDLDIITLKNGINSRKKTMKSRLADKDTKEKAGREKETLENLLDKVITSTLNTINEVLVYGNYYIKQNNLRIFEPKNPIDYYQSKLENYIKKIKLVDLIRRDLSIEEVRGYLKNKGRNSLKWSFEADIKEIGKGAKSFLPIIKKLAKKEDWVYTQGDEFFHHFLYRMFKGRSGVGVLKSGIYDWSHAMMTNPILSRVKPLSDSLLDLEYKDAEKYFLEALVSAENLKVNTGERKNKIKDISGIEDKHIMDSIMKFDIFALYEILCNIGRKSLNEIISKESRDMITDLTVEYANPNIKFPGNGGPINITYSPYQTNESISILIKRLKERMDIILNQKTDYKLDGEKIDQIGKIQEFTEKNIIREIEEDLKREGTETSESGGKLESLII